MSTERRLLFRFPSFSGAALESSTTILTSALNENLAAVSSDFCESTNIAEMIKHENSAQTDSDSTHTDARGQHANVTFNLLSAVWTILVSPLFSK